ncbi:putative signal transduction protein [Thiorhodococcus drewsii AZ1]|uniref:Putative signal transduction protein n=1 Tax=Thiorhodococcus drewsii AZ1 TaxID=765913 RepID=G2E323_9GAMM|nr:HDOD domain-containing protein [Thiorhodococcus drewsii]EGV30485.1 putative signal transduction protein [Thiorhodococcus drewsii AZ1]
MSSLTLDSLVRKTGRLLAIPRVVGEILRLLNDTNSRQADIAALLAQDPALVAIVLRLANSPAFAPARTVDSVDRAIMLLGRDHLRRLVVAGAVTQASERLPMQNLLPLEVFWRHSSYCAVIARLLAERQSPDLVGTVFLGGLLHDLGQLVLFSQVPEEAHAAFLRSLEHPDALSPEAAEREELGFDHAQLGAALAERWGLPDVLCACLGYHHAPLRAPEAFRVPVGLVHLANSASHLAELDSRNWRDAPPTEPAVLKSLAIDSDLILELIDEAQYQVLAVEALRNPRLADDG